MFLIIFTAFLYGCATVVSKMVNYRATQELGTWNGSLANYVVASILALILLLLSPYLQTDLHACTQVPVHLYAGGDFRSDCFCPLDRDSAQDESVPVHHPPADRPASGRNPV